MIVTTYVFTISSDYITRYGMQFWQVKTEEILSNTYEVAEFQRNASLDGCYSLDRFNFWFNKYPTITVEILLRSESPETPDRWESHDDGCNRASQHGGRIALISCTLAVLHTDPFGTSTLHTASSFSSGCASTHNAIVSLNCTNKMFSVSACLGVYTTGK